jgi:uncharacterized membrane protein YdjX (TVP38/TMEM64 family)
LSVLLVFAVLGRFGAEYGSDYLKSWADAEIRGHGWQGIALYVGVGAVLTGLGFSRQVLALIAGYVFGTGAGTAIALLAEMMGVAAGFAVARRAGRRAMLRRFPERIRRVDEYLEANPFLMTVAIRLFPLSHNLVVNVLAGVSHIRSLPFISGSAVGHLPQTLIFAMVGSGVAASNYLQGVLAAVLFAISTLIGVHLHHRYRRSRVFEGSTADILHMEWEARQLKRERAD